MNLSDSNLIPSLHDTIRTIIDRVMLDVCVCLPGKIVSYDFETQYADVEIQLLQGYSNGNTLPYPVIPNVPVKHPRGLGGTAFIHMPLVAGDDVVLVFSQRSLDNWKTQGGMSDPDDPRKHHITDAYALVGGSALPDAFTPETDDAIEITNGAASLQVFADGGFKIKNGENELVSLVQQVVALLGNPDETVVNTLLGPQPLVNFAQFQELAAQIETLVETEE